MKTLCTPNHSEHVSTNKGKVQKERAAEGRHGILQKGDIKGCVLYRAPDENKFLKSHLHFTVFYCDYVRHED